LILKNIELFQRKPEKTTRFQTTIGIHLLIETSDNKCIFLKKDYKCAIYDQRPQTCRDYGLTKELPCPYINSLGVPRSQKGVERTRKEIAAYVDAGIARLMAIDAAADRLKKHATRPSACPTASEQNSSNTADTKSDSIAKQD
jgi:hypothetical protein